MPHPYYFREMYLPQLTTGPSSLAWSPDSTVNGIFHGGIVVVQKIDSTRPTIDRRARIRLSARLVSGRTMDRLREI